MRVLVLFLWLSFSYAVAQTLNYEVKVSGVKVGNLVVSKNAITHNQKVYKATTNVLYGLVNKSRIEYYYEATYTGSVLTQAYFEHKKDGELVERAELTKGVGGYKSLINENEQLLEGLFSNSMIKLYFEEPSVLTEVFSERFHDMVKISVTDIPRKYKMAIPNGDENYYTYNSKGICALISVSKSVLRLEMALIEGSGL